MHSVLKLSKGDSLSSMSSSRHVISPPVQGTHLLLRIYLLITIYFSWFAFVPQFTPVSHPSISVTPKLCGFQLKWPRIKHHDESTACLGMEETWLIF